MFLHRFIISINAYLPPTNHWLTLVATIPVAFATGTLFVYSAFSTQLAEKCGLDVSQTGNLNISATLGSALGGILSGIVTDMYGSQLPILFSCIMLSLGYFWLYCSYLQGFNATSVQLLAAMFFVGLGSVSGYFSSLKAVVVNFPDNKGAAQSVTIASFAISSLIYLWVSTKVLNGDTEKFLLILSISCGILTLFGFIFIRLDGHIDNVDQEEESFLADMRHEIEYLENIDTSTSESTSLMDGSTSDILANSSNNTSRSNISEEYRKANTLTPQVIQTTVRNRQDLKHKSLKDSLLHPIFWFHYFIFSITQGFGQMYIYSVGFILKAEHYYYTHEKYLDPLVAPNTPTLHYLQALHVSIIALSSFGGRLASGPVSDIFVKKFQLQRHWGLIFGTIIMFIGHVLLMFCFPSRFQYLYQGNIILMVISCLIGFAYGFTFTCYPVIVSDIFSLQNYSFIWGCLYTSTTFGLTFMSKLFGMIYDMNSDYWDDKSKSYVCNRGSWCYQLTFEITSLLCIFVISVVLIFIYIRHRYR